MAGTRDFVVALGKALFPALNFGSRRSYHGKWSTFYAGAITQLHKHIDSAQRDVHPLTAGDGKPIDDWGTALKVPKKGATPARKASAGRVRGNAGATVLPGAQMRHGVTGLLYAIGNATTITIPGIAGVDPDSFFDADIVGIDVGSQTRLDAKETLTFLSAPPGIQANVVLQLPLDQDGFDVEQFGSYRGNVLGTLSATPSGGNADDFAGWAKASLSTVRTGYSLPLRAGRGAMDLVGFYAATASSGSRALTAQDRAAVLAYVASKAPFNVQGALRVLTTVADPQRVEIRLTTNGIPAFQFDWNDAPGYTVASYNAATREVQFSGGSLPSTLKAGHGILFDGAAGGSGVNNQDGTEFKIQAISAVDKVILQTAPAVNLGATDRIYSGGPLVFPVRTAIVGHLNGELVYAGRGLTPIAESQAAPANPNGPSVLGLDTLAQGIGPANPGQKYGNWSGGITLATLFRIATYKAGVANATIVSPAADYQPLDDDPFLTSQIHYVTPKVVLIRSA